MLHHPGKDAVRYWKPLIGTSRHARRVDSMPPTGVHDVCVCVCVGPFNAGVVRRCWMCFLSPKPCWGSLLPVGAAVALCNTSGGRWFTCTKESAKHRVDSGLRSKHLALTTFFFPTAHKIYPLESREKLKNTPSRHLLPSFHCFLLDNLWWQDSPNALFWDLIPSLCHTVPCWRGARWRAPPSRQRRSAVQESVFRFALPGTHKRLIACPRMDLHDISVELFDAGSYAAG